MPNKILSECSFKLKHAFGFSIVVNIWVAWYYFMAFNVMYFLKIPKSIRCLLIAFIERLSDLWGPHKYLNVQNASFAAMSAGVAIQKPKHIEDKYRYCPFRWTIWALVWPQQCCLALGRGGIFLPFPLLHGSPPCHSPWCQCRLWPSIQICAVFSWVSGFFAVCAESQGTEHQLLLPPSPDLHFSGGCHLPALCCCCSLCSPSTQDFLPG